MMTSGVYEQGDSNISLRTVGRVVCFAEHLDTSSAGAPAGARIASVGENTISSSNRAVGSDFRRYMDLVARAP